MTDQQPRLRGRPRAVDADEKTARILSEAANLFAKQGFNKTSFASVAAAVGMSLPGLTHYFPSKIDLLLAVLDDRDADASPGDLANSHGDIFETLDAVMTRDLTTGAELTKLFSILSAEAQSAIHPAHHWFKERDRKVLTSLRNDLGRLQKDGRIKPDIDCGAEAVAILAMMDGLQTWWLRMPDDCDALACFRQFLASTKDRLFH